jgi:hypothetical protein
MSIDHYVGSTITELPFATATRTTTSLYIGALPPNPEYRVPDGFDRRHRSR